VACASNILLESNTLYKLFAATIALVSTKEMSSQNFLSVADIDRRVTAAQNVVLDFETATTEPIKDLVKANANANAIGNFLPSFIGVISLPGASHTCDGQRAMEGAPDPLEKKSPALDRFLHPIQKIEAEFKCTQIQMHANSNAAAEIEGESDEGHSEKGLPSKLY
jgi:hypothetical protein